MADQPLVCKKSGNKSYAILIAMLLPEDEDNCGIKDTAALPSTIPKVNNQTNF